MIWFRFLAAFVMVLLYVTGWGYFAYVFQVRGDPWVFLVPLSCTPVLFIIIYGIIKDY